MIIGLSMLSGCGYKFSPQEIDMWNVKGGFIRDYSCGSYMRIASQGWLNTTYEVSYTDKEGLDHEAHGLAAVTLNDIPTTTDAPMSSFQYSPEPGERYGNKPDGTPGDVIKEGDIVLKGDSKARLVNGTWKPVKIPNTVCEKS